MIDIATLTDADKGREVCYESGVGNREYGKITSWNEKYIFVRYHLRVSRYGKQSPRYGGTSEATSPEHIHFTG